MEILIRENIKNLVAYSSAREEFEDFADVFLDANENPFENGVNRYPDPYQKQLKAKIAELKGVENERIILGNGSDEILDLIFRSFCEPKKDKIIICPPTYGMYKVMAEINDVAVKEVLLNEDFSFNLTEIKASSDINTKLLILCSPNNPTGNSIKTSELIDLLRSMTCLVIVDEAYIDFSEQESALSLLNDFPKLIVVQTLSKAWGMASLRIGMAFGSEAIVRLLNKVKTPYNINGLSQQKALSMIQNKTLFDSQKGLIKTQKEILINELKHNSLVQKIYPSDANFLLVKFTDSKYVFDQLKANGIIVRDRSSQALCENCLRITIGTETENTSLINILKSIDL